MSRKFLTTQEALDFLWTLDDSDFEDNDNELVIVPPDPDLMSDTEEIDDSSVRKVEEIMCDEVGSTEVAGTIEILVPNRNENISVNPKWEKCEPKFERTPKAFPQERLQRVKDNVAGKSPIELFEIICLKMIELTVVESIKYSRQNNNHGFEISMDEMKQFLAILFYSGYHILPQEKMYWENAPDTGTLLVSKSMSRKRYYEIKKYLHFNDNLRLDRNDRYFKVRPLYNLLNEGLQQFGVFSEFLSIDERMVRYFGKHGCKMYIKGKPVKFGYKLWMLTSFNGFPYYIIPYQGAKQNKTEPASIDNIPSTSKCQAMKTLQGQKKKNPKVKKNQPCQKNVNEPLSHTVVQNLLSIIANPEIHKIYMDNFFTSHELLSILATKNFFVTGTVREHRMFKCPLMSSKAMSKLERGFSDSRFDTRNKIAAVRWNDNRVVSVITNFEETKSISTVERRVKGGRKQVKIPACITSYNKYKNGVDLFDNHAASYFTSIQGKKWYWPLFVNAFETALVASWKLNQLFGENSLSLLDFRRHITVAYLGISIPRKPSYRKLGLQQRNADFLRIQNEHVLIKHPENRQRRCQLKPCTGKPTTICKKCNVGLCLRCFDPFHSSKNE